MNDDIVAELAWLATTAIWSGKDPHLRETLRRARDEIVALREDRDTLFAAMEERGPAIRAEALEQAARACERLVNRETWPENYHPLRDPDPSTCMMCAAWILKLKGDL